MAADPPPLTTLRGDRGTIARAINDKGVVLRFDHLHIHRELSRRDALRAGTAGVIAAAGLTLGTSSSASAGASGRRRDHDDDEFSDEMFDAAAVAANGWGTSPYGPGDQRGTFNELTPAHAAEALKLLRRGQDVHWYQMGEELFNGFPAYPSDPPRRHDMFIFAQGYEPPPEFVAEGGILGTTEPIGPNLLSGNEERFGPNYTFQIATQLDGLGHVGVADVYYNGFRAPDFASATGLQALGAETTGPVITRGVIYDVLGLKLEQGASADLSQAPNGEPILRDNYRITIDDLRACLDRQRLRGVGPGDVPILRTGWTHLAHTDPVRYLAQEPGIFLAEARYFADKKVALIAGDAWGLEVVDPAVTGGNAFPCHQELFGKYGIRIGEGFVSEAAIADGVDEGVLIITPQNVPGATAGSSPPVLLGQPRRRGRT